MPMPKQKSSRTRNTQGILINLAEGFSDDCDELMHKCLETETLNYQVFCNIWKDMNFALVFQGKTTGVEVAELSEELVAVAKRYMVGNTTSYEECVAGLFLVYSLLHLQPYKRFAKLRITPADLDAIHSLEDMARRQRRYDVLYILGSLMIGGYVEFHIADREYGIESSMRKAFDAPVSTECGGGVRPRGVFYRQTEELHLLRELSVLGGRYSLAKASISGGKKPERTLSYVNEQLAAQLAASLKQLISGSLAVGAANMRENRSDVVMKIKQRAMIETVTKMRHLMSTEDSERKCPPSPSSSKSPRKSSPRKKALTSQGEPDNLADGEDDKSPKGTQQNGKKTRKTTPKGKCASRDLTKNKTDNLERKSTGIRSTQINKRSPRKKQAAQKTKRKRKSKKSIDEDTTSEEELEDFKLETDLSSNATDTKSEQSCEADESRTVESSEKIIPLEKYEVPVVFTDLNSQIEIEFIDNLKTTTNNIEEPENEPDIILPDKPKDCEEDSNSNCVANKGKRRKKATNNETQVKEEETRSTRSKTRSLEAQFEGSSDDEPVVYPKVKSLQRTILASKLKRLGLLSVADIDEPVLKKRKVKEVEK
ncbi:hypothetical protein JYU34_015030 [Plutella xylostella]|uniref:snRNA-activating protein complex subunit 1 n=1 Tax=Plutella xylostella TaxID=51655 RepID=A0ABQ7Q7H7_PLUXY|nr:hypothetical protein JYU34_015030 [Plutella xylostella]